MLGIVCTTFLMRLRGYTLDHAIGWLDLLGMSFLGGIGVFTVALPGWRAVLRRRHSTDDKVKIAVLLGSCTAVIGAAILAARNRRYRHASKPARYVNGVSRGEGMEPLDT